MKYGYARVSTSAQDLAGQLAELEAAGCEKILQEAASAAEGRRRPVLATLVRQLQAGDQVTVTRLNRLARSTRDALNTLAAIVEKGAHFRSLREPWCDTTTPYGRLMTTILSGLAEFDREMILERTAEGRARARQNGIRLGRPPAITGPQLRYIIEGREAVPPVPLSHLSRVTGVSLSTVKRVVRAWRMGQEVGTIEAQGDIEEIAAGDQAAAGEVFKH